MFVCVIKMSMCQELRAKYYLFSRIIEKNDSLNTTKAVRVVRPWEFMPKGLGFGLGLWRFHIVLGQGLQFLNSIGRLFSAPRGVNC